MQRVALPFVIVDSAIRDAMRKPNHEVGGFFGCRYRPDGNTLEYGWLSTDNIHPNPEIGTELPASWIAEMVVQGRWEILAFFHSHPSGRAEPSPADYEKFPYHYTSNAFVWSHKLPDHLVHYTHKNETVEYMEKRNVSVYL